MSIFRSLNSRFEPVTSGQELWHQVIYEHPFIFRETTACKRAFYCGDLETPLAPGSFQITLVVFLVLWTCCNKAAPGAIFGAAVTKSGPPLEDEFTPSRSLAPIHEGHFCNQTGECSSKHAVFDNEVTALTLSPQLRVIHSPRSHRC